MEPFLTVNGLLRLKEKGLCVKKLIMDDDTTTFVLAKRSLSDDIEKAGDKNHIIKNMTNELYKIKDKNKNMSVKTIKYFSKCFSYVLSQNKGNPEGIRSNLKAVTPHAFGCHDYCNVSWCRFLSDKENYTHKSLPFGKDLVGEVLRTDLEALFSRYSSEAMLHKLSDLQSSNLNENLNQMIARKAPKAVHYSGSESLDYRISAAVSQKNEGQFYLVKVNETHNLSPGKFTQKKLNALDQKRNLRKHSDMTIEKKRRRLELKEARLSNQNTHEVLEGKTYESGVSILDDTESIDIEEIPALDTFTPTCTTIENVELDNFIIFGLETTGLNFDVDIIQIAATDMTTESQFQMYVRPPSGYIPKRVTEITELEMHGLQMYHKLIPVKSTGIKVALELFQNWIKQFSRCVLVAHNANYDAKVFMNACEMHSINIDNLIGFADSLKLFRKLYPDRKGKGAHSQSSLVNDIFHKSYDEHNAIADVSCLKELLLSVESVKEKLSVFSVNDVNQSIKRIKNEKMFYKTYTQMIYDKMIPKSHAKNLAGRGLSLKHLETIHERSGVQGLQVICKGISTNPAKVATNISAAFSTTKTDQS
ncbi:uncharacterized protein LOC128559651 [Mercenaria mercenaria]|uniref:uncharacterized protein LOC128559651 n=1 Tax=Mercenaria mercenaria TaxID=6596 RepID=UPI00234E4D3C|nr:uncharacterized protein LOC128559651 [Mercenaria mercenaria]